MKIRNCIFIGIIFISSCSSIDWTKDTVDKFNEMKPPVVLFGKTKSLNLYGVSVMDGNNKIHHFGNKSNFANSIGESYQIGDTLKQHTISY
jgi:hypothetical protein